ncbi:MAG TPA: bifunctional riboflavin kinase/FAD synthetase [Candidatus Binatia bacterium]|nr:bifunctional riboflavin kinase/FAD synthetase [Candidatus Binatia bacterium]
MEIFRHIDDRGLASHGCVATMGNFDGIHVGHQSLIRGAVEEARSRGLPSVVLTFEPHPLKLLAPERAPKLLLAHKDKMQLLQSFGVDIVVIQQFNALFASLPAEEFVRRYLVHRLKVKKIWVGKDLRFGRERRGAVSDLIRWGGDLGFQVGVVEPILLDGIRVSSSHIRELLEQGRVEEVQAPLGRYHFISGRVVGGHRRGRQLGFPTANISPRTEALPSDGIYATLLTLEATQWLSVSSIGVNPTFGAGSRTVESFIFDFSRDIYGEIVKLSFVKRIRNEQPFATVDHLVAQMHEDVKTAKNIFSHLKIGHSPPVAHR